MDGTRFTRNLLDWYDANRRDLPWRDDPGPYPVWISEIMAQQTQMDRVVEYHRRWMRHYPDPEALAKAPEEAVLKSWEGLGYYNRARNIRKAAARIVDEFGGEFPSDPAVIRSLPGIGEYTAGAIASIAFGQPVPAIDANVLRVFARVLDIDTPIREKAGRGQVEACVRELLPEDRPGDFNQALMELGALVCSRLPDCPVCPVKEHCLAHARGTIGARPVLPPGKDIIRINMATGVLVHEGQALIQKRRPDDVWPGLWEFPGGCLEQGETPEEALVREYREEVELDVVPEEKITVVAYSYTRYRVTMHCYLCRPANGDVPAPVFNAAVEGGFVQPASLADYAFPSGHRRLIDFMRNDLRFAELFRLS
ncbi:A/G-specific adenine glycosylase [Pseudodesulfovibrio cashew]|uniref:Adenine DNA glycosylase n=1 Tax=Pseudodesulfovibrio cashew TaxID=2678688 RepID=A0A6I6JKX0_9BACT|nr:A/G-specific adenine glycosylase [Pseudodesulfovibrio cashew]QGY40942.1 A/G-specific adenine glycosylase [Pseudodesulfovibrio cashew]